ncbi:hypothetical protein KBZ18_10920 [Synechococcus sp. Cruz-9H2]|uniref:hypothetical protein n=1 Tax=unclassified Synechococcus TaxID=2626047 RepID=UPI0020CCEE06|nr:MULTISPECIES: hypothetical protein [unclassified Synechococcus]MCP9820002.1 hypothetical protein [Synechococcus sp. Cruz-9H2]MCP9844308.1 hypothetical protein [Synechococcus sp. Edmonson 11F2]MCP9856432.1 hypothetical protein [Synechococcus sp. Cruz-9C9]MCP9863793.1 hypothetical protein [Synechococcus sp. Cruz-7E5]MCP9870912.1 hypothetical protein [Synechococcus sp. Cruz-7B9]
MPSPLPHSSDPALLLRRCREAIHAVLEAPEARRAHGAPFCPSERRFLQLVVLPVIDQFLGRLQLIRAAQEQQQWEHYAAVPPEEAGPSSGGG